ncbi:hypothetical protein BZG36_02189 [Bifiguratus adelaidae]|uniref:Uncharacterized protein n=1 Tax=Bifiguratus adelaidae TaxID=1938954 RepID=A0A261Y0Q0_9FUNG|nr:hypothetical protein BZG36_02189 [Bifiguratus adelaidae]
MRFVGGNPARQSLSRGQTAQITFNDHEDTISLVFKATGTIEVYWARFTIAPSAEGGLKLRSLFLKSFAVEQDDILYSCIRNVAGPKQYIYIIENRRDSIVVTALDLNLRKGTANVKTYAPVTFEELTVDVCRIYSGSLNLKDFKCLHANLLLLLFEQSYSDLKSDQSNVIYPVCYRIGHGLIHQHRQRRMPAKVFNSDRCYGFLCFGPQNSVSIFASRGLGEHENSALIQNIIPSEFVYDRQQVYEAALRACIPHETLQSATCITMSPGFFDLDLPWTALRSLYVGTDDGKIAKFTVRMQENFNSASKTQHVNPTGYAFETEMKWTHNYQQLVRSITLSNIELANDEENDFKLVVESETNIILLRETDGQILCIGGHGDALRAIRDASTWHRSWYWIPDESLSVTSLCEVSIEGANPVESTIGEYALDNNSASMDIRANLQKQMQKEMRTIAALKSEREILRVVALQNSELVHELSDAFAVELDQVPSRPKSKACKYPSRDLEQLTGDLVPLSFGQGPKLTKPPLVGHQEGNYRQRIRIEDIQGWESAIMVKNISKRSLCDLQVHISVRDASLGAWQTHRYSGCRMLAPEGRCTLYLAGCHPIGDTADRDLYVTCSYREALDGESSKDSFDIEDVGIRREEWTFRVDPRFISASLASTRFMADPKVLTVAFPHNQSIVVFHQDIHHGLPSKGAFEHFYDHFMTQRLHLRLYKSKSDHGREDEKVYSNLNETLVCRMTRSASSESRYHLSIYAQDAILILYFIRSIVLASRAYPITVASDCSKRQSILAVGNALVDLQNYINLVRSSQPSPDIYRAKRQLYFSAATLFSDD